MNLESIEKKSLVKALFLAYQQIENLESNYNVLNDKYTYMHDHIAEFLEGDKTLAERFGTLRKGVIAMRSWFYYDLPFHPMMHYDDPYNGEGLKYIYQLVALDGGDEESVTKEVKDILKKLAVMDEDLKIKNANEGGAK